MFVRLTSGRARNASPCDLSGPQLYNQRKSGKREKTFVFLEWTSHFHHHFLPRREQGVWLVLPYMVRPGLSCCCLVAQSCLTLCDLMDCSTPGLPVLHYLQGLTKLMSIELMMQFDHLILCHLLILLLSILPSIRVFSVELVLCIKWPKYWSFSIRPSKEHSGLIFF